MTSDRRTVKRVSNPATRLKTRRILEIDQQRHAENESLEQEMTYLMDGMEPIENSKWLVVLCEEPFPYSWTV